MAINNETITVSVGKINEFYEALKELVASVSSAEHDTSAYKNAMDVLKLDESYKCNKISVKNEVFMKTNLIEITVSGVTGSGKSEACQVIENALKNFYGIHTQVASRALSNERNMCGDPIDAAKKTGQTANRENTVFVIYEDVAKSD